MFASLHVADVGLLQSFRIRPPSPESVPGLLDARSGLTARLAPSFIPDPAWGRAMWLAFWEDEASLDRFLETDDPIVKQFSDGWSVRMIPLRAHGAWPGFPTDLTAEAAEETTGPVVVLTIGLLRMKRALAWTRASTKVQKQFVDTPGVVWAMGASRPPKFVATMSVWESAAAAAGFAKKQGEAHLAAMTESSASPFMREEIFARFRPVATSGSLGPSPELQADWLLDRAS